MQDIDELLKQQRDLIIKMDNQHQRQLNSLHERITRVESQIQSFHQNAENNNNTNDNDATTSNNQIQLSKNAPNQRSNIEMTKNLLVQRQSYSKPSASQEKLPKLNSSFPR